MSTASYAYYALPDDHLKPSERFARPNGPVFLVDEERKKRMNKEPTFTYAFKQDRHQQQHSNSSPMTDAGGGGENTTDSPPTTSFEELVTSSSSVLVLPYTDHAQLPHLPPKSPSRTTQKHQQPTRINLPELQTSFELQHGHEHDQDQESRDQLSPLLSSPRKLDYTYASKNIISPPTAYITPVSPPTSDDNGHEQVHVQAGKSPSRRRPFFTFGNRNVIGNAQSITKPPSHPPKIGNNDGRNVAATSLDSLGRDKAIIQGARNTKSSKHVRRNSADDVDVYNHHGRPSSMDHAAHSSTESTSPNERESISSLTGDMKAMTAHDNISQDKRSSRSLTKGLVASLGRRSRSSSRSTAEITPPLPKSSIATASQAKPGSEDGGIIPTPKWKAYENRQTRPNGMVAALQEDWVEITPSPAQAIASKGDGPDIMDGNKASEIHSKSRSPPYPINRKKYLSSTNTTTEPSKLNSPYLPKTPSPIKLRHRALPANWRNETTSLPDGSPSPHPVKNDSAMPHATVSPASPPYSPPPRENLRSPPFFMRGRLAGQKKGNTPGSGVSSNNPRSPVKKGSTVLTPPTPPISQSPAAMEASPPRTIAAWPAESHVFGAAQAVIGKATIGPHITPQFKTLPFSSPAETVQKNSPIITSSFPAPSGQNNSGKLNNGISTLVNAGTEEEDDVFGGTLQSPKDQRKRVFDLLNISRSRKSSLYTNTTTSSYQSSGTNTPVNLPLSRNYTGKPKLEEAILNFPENILAGILDYMSFRSFKKLLFSSPKLYRAAYNDVNGQSKFMEVVKQRFLAPYGYLPLPSSSKSASSNKNIKKNNIHFTMRDLNTFQIGIEYSLSEYSIFASEHLRKPLKPSIIKIIRESTRSFNKLAFRLQFQSHFITSLYLLPQSSTPKTHIIGEDIQEEGERIVPRLIKPHWVNYKRIDQQNQVFKEGRCISLRVWIPCQSHWMTDEEIVQVEKELHKVGIWKYLRKGDLVRNVALGDIANEGILIFDGKYFRDLSYNFDIIGHLPSWVNSLTFSPSYFHNQIASSTSDPIVYLDLTPWKSTIQSNLLLCKEKVDMTSPSGEQYKITRYIYRTVIELIPGAIIRDSTNKGETETVHPDWAGQLIIETDGTTEAAKALLQRVTSISTETISPDQPKIPAHVNNRPYAILRNLSRPGLIFCRVIPDTRPGMQFGE